MVQDAIARLPAKTGRSLEQWIALIRKSGPSDRAARRDWLKVTHKLGTNYATWLADRADGRGETGDPAEYLAAAERYVDDMFAGAKAPLRPTFDALLSLGLSLGPDVKACPCKTTVPFYRTHVIAHIKPATRIRIDLGLALGTAKVPARVIPTGGLAKGDRITHRIAIASPAEIDDTVKRWFAKAYQLDEG